MGDSPGDRRLPAAPSQTGGDAGAPAPTTASAAAGRTWTAAADAVRPADGQGGRAGTGGGRPQPWAVQIGWELPHAGSWQVRVAGVGRRVFLHLVVDAPAATRLEDRGWDEAALRRLLEAWGLEPAGVSVRAVVPPTVAGTPADPGRP